MASLAAGCRGPHSQHGLSRAGFQHTVKRRLCRAAEALEPRAQDDLASACFADLCAERQANLIEPPCFVSDSCGQFSKIRRACRRGKPNTFDNPYRTMLTG